MQPSPETPKKMKSDAFLKKANERAHLVIAGMGALTTKLKELLPQIEETREDFRKLKGNQTIAGCKTWKQFCLEKLHRTDSAVRKLLAAGRKEKQKPAGNLPADSVAADDACGAPAESTHEASEEEKKDEREKDQENKSKACKALREFLGNIPDQNALTELLREMFPDYLVTVTISSLPFTIEHDECDEQGATQ